MKRIGATFLVLLLLLLWAGCHIFRRAGGAGTRAKIRVELLNGSGKTGALEHWEPILREEGYRIIYVGNASRLFEKTTLLLREEPETMRLAHSLGNRIVKNPTLEAQSPENHPEDLITIIVGRDAFEKYTEPEGGRF